MSNYLKIPAIIKEIEAHAQKMEDGKLSLEELTQLLDYSRQLNERVAILRYKALTGNSKPMESKSVENKGITKEQILQEISTKPKEESKKEEEGFSFDFTSSDGVVGIEPSTQRSLLDQIKEDKGSSVNDKLAEIKQESVAERLQKSKIEDIRSVIGIGQKFLFMNDLFKGEKSHYDQTIDKINTIHNKAEAENYLNNTVASKFNWDESSESVKNFRQIVDRKF